LSVILPSHVFQQLAISTSFLNGTQDQNESEEHLIENDTTNIKVTMEKTQEKKVTIKAFKKLKSTVYKLDRDNVGQYLIFDNIEPNKTINLDEYQ
jgi:hypothetical protein